MNKTGIIYKIVKKCLLSYNYLLSLPFRLRYRKIFVFGDNCIIRKCKISSSRNGRVIIGNNVLLLKCVFHFENGVNVIKIGDNVSLRGVEFIERYGGENVISIGRSTTMGATQLEASENCSLQIGDDCMFSYNIKVWASAHHSILYDGKRANPSESIIIGDHCWIGHSACVLKGSIVPDGCIVGVNSLYTKKNNIPNAIYVGSPAKMIRENISWCRDLLPINEKI
ncbi:MAG: hypothetical protein J6W13_02100 [Salinivirgaceae bacterium]|nr:hypothetical protein [Salinivirgaceae bacterium]